MRNWVITMLRSSTPECASTCRFCPQMDGATDEEFRKEAETRGYILVKDEPISADLKFTKSYTFKYVAAPVIAIWVGFQVFMMTLWYWIPQYDEFFNRYSLSDSQGLGIAAAVLLIYMSWRNEKMLYRLGKRAGLKGTSTVEEEFFDMISTVKPYWSAAERQMRKNKISPEAFGLLLGKLFKQLDRMAQREATVKKMDEGAWNNPELELDDTDDKKEGKDNEQMGSSKVSTG